jgi:nucleotide-binding universal stress UspA family protein
LFPDLTEVFVLTVLREKNLDDAVPAEEIASHIRRHGIQASATCIDLEPFENNAGPAIANFAKAKSVDLLVMGGYGRSRLRELLLGGVTEYLSRDANVPLLLIH